MMLGGINKEGLAADISAFEERSDMKMNVCFFDDDNDINGDQKKKKMDKTQFKEGDDNMNILKDIRKKNDVLVKDKKQ